MAYDEELADRVRASMGATHGLSEMKIFGGLAIMVNGHMAVGVLGSDLIVRVAKEDHARLETETGARTMEMMAGRPAAGFLLIEPGALTKKPKLDTWVKRGVTYAQSLPPKPAKKSHRKIPQEIRAGGKEGVTSEIRSSRLAKPVTMALMLDEESCDAASASKDARFDGSFIAAVTTPRIYCRPSCPAITPRREHLRFYPTAAAAPAGGFRACKHRSRCGTPPACAHRCSGSSPNARWQARSIRTA